MTETGTNLTNLPSIPTPSESGAVGNQSMLPVPLPTPAASVVPSNPSEPLSRAFEGLASRPNVIGGSVTATMINAAMQTKDALLTERSSDLRVMQTKCESMRDQVEALNIRIAVADEKLAAATKSKKLLTVIATVGGLFASKGWSMLDKPGLENVGWGLIVIGALCASAAIIYPWLGRNK